MTPEERAKMVRDQMNSKILWGTSEEEALGWLRERHCVTDEVAHQYIVEARRHKRSAVRKKATVYLVCSVVGMVCAIAFIWVKEKMGIVVIGTRSGIVHAAAFVCFLVCIRSVIQLLSGDTDGSVD